MIEDPLRHGSNIYCSRQSPVGEFAGITGHRKSNQTKALLRIPLLDREFPECPMDRALSWGADVVCWRPAGGDRLDLPATPLFDSYSWPRTDVVVNNTDNTASGVFFPIARRKTDRYKSLCLFLFRWLCVVSSSFFLFLSAPQPC